MVTDKSFIATGTQRIFSSDFAIISDEHLRVYLDTTVVAPTKYDLINNAAVFHTAPAAGTEVTVQVGTTPDDLLTHSPYGWLDATSLNTCAGISAEIGTVATNIADVNTVAGISGDVSTVASITGNIIAVSADEADIGTVATNIADVNTVVANIANVNTVATNIADVNNFADTYFTGATAPSTPTLGDLWFYTTVDKMLVYTAFGWQDAGHTTGIFDNASSTRLTVSDIGISVVGNVTATGTVDGRDVAADGVTADAALPKAGGALTGAVTTTSTFDGRDVAADGVTADAALPKAGGTMTGTIAGFTSTGIFDNATSTKLTVSDNGIYVLGDISALGTVDGRDVAADGLVLDSIKDKSSYHNTKVRYLATEDLGDSLFRINDLLSDMASQINYIAHNFSTQISPEIYALITTPWTVGGTDAQGDIDFNGFVATTDAVLIDKYRVGDMVGDGVTGTEIQVVIEYLVSIVRGDPTTYPDYHEAKIALGTTSTTALAGDTAYSTLALGTTSTTALAGDTTIPTALSNIADSATGIDITGDLALSNGKGVKLYDSTGTASTHYSSDAIYEAGTGNFSIYATDLHLEATALGTGNKYLHGNDSTGAVTLYNGTDAKLATTATGIDVTGSVTADDYRSESTKSVYLTYGTDLRVRTNTGAEKLRIDSAGNVGIGTTTPTRTLHIEDTVANPFMSIVGNSTTSIPGILFGHTVNDSKGQVRYSNVDNSMRIYTGAAERMRIDSTGSVGIGTSSPGAKLDVDGRILSSGEKVPKVFVQTSQPAQADSSPGDLWWDTDGYTMYVAHPFTATFEVWYLT